MSKTFNIYCGESTHLKSDEHPYMLLGCVNVAYPQIKMAREQIRTIKAKHKYEGGLEWTNIHDATYPMYSELIEYFFMTDMKFRVVIMGKSQVNETRPEYTFNGLYFEMYYQFLHHLTDMENEYNVFFNIKGMYSHDRLHKLQEILRWNSSIRRFQLIHSHKSYFMRLADILIGAINYSLRTGKGDVEGKVIAKKKLINEIHEHTDIPLDRTTPLSKKKFNLLFISLR